MLYGRDAKARVAAQVQEWIERSRNRGECLAEQAVDVQVGHDIADAKASVAAGEEKVRRSRKRSKSG
jgi:hypothetical protein